VSFAVHKKTNRLEALRIWHNVNLKTVLRSGPDLTSRQLAILTIVYLENGPHTVRSIANRLNVTKAVITRGLDTLGRQDLLARVSDPRDKRSIIIRRTGPGATYLSRFADHIASEMDGTIKSAAAA
jgi:DNA-binding MarR family transcriptional regulator